jgi:glycosyltransferase involved in cell wall biosynthesis
MARVVVMASNCPRWEGDVWSPFILFQAQGMARRGHEMHLIAPHTAGAARYERLGEVHVHRFRYAPPGWQTLCYDGGILQNLRRNPLKWALVPGFLLSEGLALLRVIRRHRIDLIHAHWFVPQGLVAALATRLAPRPIVMTAHAGDVFATRDGLRRRLLRHAAGRAAACTAVSVPLGAALQALAGRAPEIVPMGVDLDRFRPQAAGNDVTGDGPLAAPRLLSVGRLAEKKGLHVLLRAMAALTPDLPGAHLTVVGDGPERPALQALARDLGLADRVAFLGMVPNADLPAHFAAADLFVVPSVIDSTGDREGLPVSILEAAASGVPVIATDVGGISDFVADGETGLLVPSAEVAPLAAAILRLARDGALRQRMARVARARVAEDFSWDSVTDRFDAIYARVLA